MDESNAMIPNRYIRRQRTKKKKKRETKMGGGGGDGNATATPSSNSYSPVKATYDNFCEIAWDVGIAWVVTGSPWLFRGLCGCYDVYTPLSIAKIALRGSYGTYYQGRIQDFHWGAGGAKDYGRPRTSRVRRAKSLTAWKLSGFLCSLVLSEPYF